MHFIKMMKKIELFARTTSHVAKTKYLIGQKFGGHNFRRTKIFGGQNFRHQIEISAVLSAEFFSQNKRLLTRNLSLQRDFTMCYNFSDVFQKHFRRTKISADKNFRRTKFSAPNQIFGNYVRRIFVR